MWREKGKPLKIPVKIGYKSFYVSGSVNALGTDAHSLIFQEVNTELMNLYLENLLKHYKKRNFFNNG